MGTAQEIYGAGALVAPALCFRGVTFRYRDDRPPALRDFDLDVAPGELVTVVGGNGSGKSTLARLCNGLLTPESGEVSVGGVSTADSAHAWSVRARVGLLFQDPDDQIVGASVEDDVAFGLENLGTERSEMRRRVDRILDVVGLTGEASTEPHLLSGGQKQRLALAGVLVLEPSVLVLDEPTSMLDPRGRETVLDFVRLLTARGVAVLWITQHMGEAVAGDRLLALDAGGIGYLGEPRGFFTDGTSDRFPLGVPLPLALARTVAAAGVPAATGPEPGAQGDVRPSHTRFSAAPITEEELVAYLEDLRAADSGVRPAPPPATASGAGERATSSGLTSVAATTATSSAASAEAPPAVALRGVSVAYNRGTFLERRGLVDVEVTLEQGSITAVVGATASGKSTLLQSMAGLLEADRGTVRHFGRRHPAPGEVGMVFQRPEMHLFKGTVREDVAVAPRSRGVRGEHLERRVDEALRTVGLDPREFGGRSPHALSLGEQRRVALAGVISLDPRLLVLDEPGSGLDPAARARLMERLVEWAARVGERTAGGGPPPADSDLRRTLVFSSHDMDEVATYARHVIVLHQGRVAAAGPAAGILGDVDLMRSVGLSPPLAARVAARLGFPVAAGVVDGARLADRLWSAGRGRGLAAAAVTPPSEGDAG